MPRKTKASETKSKPKTTKKAKKKPQKRGRKPLGEDKMIKTSIQLPRKIARKIETLTTRTRSRSKSQTIVRLLEQAIAAADVEVPVSVDAAIGVLGEAIEQKHGARVSVAIETHLHDLLHDEEAAAA